MSAASRNVERKVGFDGNRRDRLRAERSQQSRIRWKPAEAASHLTSGATMAEATRTILVDCRFSSFCSTEKSVVPIRNRNDDLAVLSTCSI
jgi:hypothetical protein